MNKNWTKTGIPATTASVSPSLARAVPGFLCSSGNWETQEMHKPSSNQDVHLNSQRHAKYVDLFFSPPTLSRTFLSNFSWIRTACVTTSRWVESLIRGHRFLWSNAFSSIISHHQRGRIALVNDVSSIVSSLLIRFTHYAILTKPVFEAWNSWRLTWKEKKTMIIMRILKHFLEKTSS